MHRFRAQDRIYRDRLQAAFDPLKRRLQQGHQTQRIEDLAACERHIDALPPQGLLHATREFNRRRRCAITVTVKKGHCALHIDVLVCVCLHALARFYQRALDTSDETLLANIGEIALHYDQLLETTKPRPHRWRQTGNE